MVCFEVGTSYAFIDVGLALDNESNSFFKEYAGEINIYKEGGYDPTRNHNEAFAYFNNTSLQLITKLDVIRLFANNSAHSFKIGGGYGIVRYHKTWSTNSFTESSPIDYVLVSKSYLGQLGSFKVSYEYKIKPRVIVGTYFGGTFYPSVGLLLRGNF